jgi:hypothetical protein
MIEEQVKTEATMRRIGLDEVNPQLKDQVDLDRAVKSQVSIVNSILTGMTCWFLWI